MKNEDNTGDLQDDDEKRRSKRKSLNTIFSIPGGPVCNNNLSGSVKAVKSKIALFNDK